MKNKFSIIIFLIMFFGVPFKLTAKECKKPAQAKTLSIITPLADFQKTPTDFALPFFLHHYLSHLLENNDVYFLPLDISSPKGKIMSSQAIKADYVLNPGLKFDPKKKSYTGTLSLDSISGAQISNLLKLDLTNKPIKTIEDIHELSLTTLEPLMKALGQKKMSPEKIESLNLKTAQSEAYLPYLKATLMTSALQAGSTQDIATILGLFDQALQKDYNFVPAYLGKAKLATELSSKDPRYKVIAQTELTKAKYLNPALWKIFEKEITKPCSSSDL